MADVAGRAGLAQETAGRPEEARREAWQNVPGILDALGIVAGAAVADVGAGDGFFTVRLARAVGPNGRVYAVDVTSSILEKLRKRVSDERLSNVVVTEGSAWDPRLATATLDAALIVNSYHEMTEYRAMLTKLRQALKPGGRLVIVEPISARRRDEPRDLQTKHHEIGAEHVQQEARQAGFRVARLEDPFVKRGGGGPEGDDEEWLLVLRPAAPVPEIEQRAFLEAVTAERLLMVVRYVNVKGQTWQYPLWRQMYHVVNHSTYHRGQLTTMLRQLGARPIETDLLVFDDVKCTGFIGERLGLVRK